MGERLVSNSRHLIEIPGLFFQPHGLCLSERADTRSNFQFRGLWKKVRALSQHQVLDRRDSTRACQICLDQNNSGCPSTPPYRLVTLK